MPKHKTHKGAAKRFKLTKSGKLLHRSITLRHLRASKSKRQVRSLKKMKELTSVFEKKVKKMLGLA